MAAKPRQLSTGERIAAAREKKGWTQGDLGVALGVTDAAVSFWESGQRSPRGTTQRKLAAVLGLTLDDLVPR